METTRASLLIRIRDPHDAAAWRQFHDLYAPLLYKYARGRGLSREDAEDVRSTCYETIVAKIKEFDYDKAKGGFKAWLRTLVSRRVVDLLRKHREKSASTEAMQAVEDDALGPDKLWEQHWKNHHLKYCIEQVRRDVPLPQFEAFEMLVLKGASVEEVCEQVGMNANQVYKAKSRLLRRVKAKMAEIGYEDDERL